MAFVSHCLKFVSQWIAFVRYAGGLHRRAIISLAFRKSISAEVVAIDRIEKREGMFLDVIQDCVVLTMKRRERPGDISWRLAALPATARKQRRQDQLPRDGGLWQLPTPKIIRTAKSLSDLGWKERLARWCRIDGLTA